MADISVTNTSADLSGQTLVTAEGSRSITGLLLFDRDPSAPFAVTSNSAVVSNLNADMLDGFHLSGWTSYSPVAGGDLTPGNGTTTGSSMRLGNTMFFEIAFTYGTTSSFAGANSATFTLPVAGNGLGSVTVLIQDDSGTAFQGVAVPSGSLVLVGHAAGSPVQFVPFSSTAPFIWDAGDVIRVSGWYRVS